ncbi:MAG: endonuclease III [Spirochaetaceae bacterium]
MATGPSESDGSSLRAREVSRLLRNRYPDTTPLLRFSNPFELLIAVILSAQTTDNQVNQVTPTLFSRYPTPGALASAPLEEIEAIVHSTGFFRSKAKNIRRTAAILAEKHGGEIPEAMEDLVSLPGVGRKTAHVVRGVVFGLPAIIVDTHFRRVVSRIGLSRGGTPEKVERDVELLVPGEERFAFSMAANNHGRQVCFSRKPECGRCPVRQLCDYASYMFPE